MVFAKLYLISMGLFLAIDMVWLGWIASDFYRQQIGFLMAEHIRWIPAILFYFIYLAGLMLFAILPALKESSWTSAFMLGSIFGLVCYATYDLTNFATLKGWPLKVVVYDLAWGTFISGLVSTLVFWIGAHWKIYGAPPQ